MATTTVKKPSAAEVARREAQSAKDKGEPQPVTLTVDDVTVTLDPEDLDDYDLMSMTQAGNPDPFLALCFPDAEDRKAALDKLRTPEGKLKLSTLMQWIQHVLEAAGQGNS